MLERTHIPERFGEAKMIDHDYAVFTPPKGLFVCLKPHHLADSEEIDGGWWSIDVGVGGKRFRNRTERARTSRRHDR